MSLFSLFGALEIGLVFSLVALGVYISFRLLRFPDLTVDGSFPLGRRGLCGADHRRAAPLAGDPGRHGRWRLGRPHHRLVRTCGSRSWNLLASILMMIALYSINLRIMGSPNVPLINDAHAVHAIPARRLARRPGTPLSAAPDGDGGQGAAGRLFRRPERGLAIRATGAECPHGPLHKG